MTNQPTTPPQAGSDAEREYELSPFAQVAAMLRDELAATDCLTAERDAVLCDNAALVEALQEIIVEGVNEPDEMTGTTWLRCCDRPQKNGHAVSCRIGQLLAADHPGTAILAELTRARPIVAAAERWTCLSDDSLESTVAGARFDDVTPKWEQASKALDALAAAVRGEGDAKGEVDA